MAISVVRLGTARLKNEGIRLGTVRRPPRGVPKRDYARRDFYDVWLPLLAPSQPLVTAALHATDARQWRSFERRYRAEMKRPDAAHLLDLLAAMSHHAYFSVGCYCEREDRCHRSILRSLLADRGAVLNK